MDFREHWLTHFRAAVKQEQDAAGGSLPAAYVEVGRKLEKGRDTIYQHYMQKSGKTYPTVEMMVMLEKKYGDGRPVGWAALPLGSPAAQPATAATAKVHAIPSLSPEVRKAIADLKNADDLLHLENVVRAHLRLPPAAASGHRKAA